MKTKSDTQEEHCVWMEAAKIWGIAFIIKKFQGLPTIPKAEKKDNTELLLGSLEKAWPCQHLHFKLLVSRTVRKNIYIVL